MPIWVATLYFAAASVSLRASQTVRVSGFSTKTCLPRSIDHIAGIACMWSGVAMITASMFLASLSSILRKSAYFGAFSYCLKVFSAERASGSASATMFSEAQPAMSTAPRPPAPMAAMFSFSFGDFQPSALSEGTLPNPAPGTAPARRPP